MRRRRQIPRSDLGREGAGPGSGLRAGSGSRACVRARASSSKCRVSSVGREGSRWNGLFPFHNERYFCLCRLALFSLLPLQNMPGLQSPDLSGVGFNTAAFPAGGGGRLTAHSFLLTCFPGGSLHELLGLSF